VVRSQQVRPVSSLSITRSKEILKNWLVFCCVFRFGIATFRLSLWHVLSEVQQASSSEDLYLCRDPRYACNQSTNHLKIGYNDFAKPSFTQSFGWCILRCYETGERFPIESVVCHRPPQNSIYVLLDSAEQADCHMCLPLVD
jgi:hypothetical protein